MKKDLQAFLKSINYDPKIAAEAAGADKGNGSEDAFCEPGKEEMAAEIWEQEDAKAKKDLLEKKDPSPAAGARAKLKMVRVANSRMK